MGIFSSIGAMCKSAAKTVVSAVKTAGSAIATGFHKIVGNETKAEENWNKTKDNANETKEHWEETKTNFVAIGHAISGRDKFEEAEQIYSEMSERYNSKRTQFVTEMDKLIDEIENCVNTINVAKNTIQLELFVQMANNLAKIKDIKLPEGFTIEEYKAIALTVDTIRNKDELYKIDFNKLTFKQTALGIITFGGYTRKKANETLRAVKEEGMKINNEISKMDAELLRVNAVLSSLQNVEHYFESLISLYRQLLTRLDNSVQHLYFKCMQFAHKLVDQGLSIKFLPNSQQKEIEALITASKILKVMTQTQIIGIKKTDTDTYENNMRESYIKFEECYKAA